VLQMYRLLLGYKAVAYGILDENIVYREIRRTLFGCLFRSVFVFLFLPADQQPIADIKQRGKNE